MKAFARPITANTNFTPNWVPCLNWTLEMSCRRFCHSVDLHLFVLLCRLAKSKCLFVCVSYGLGISQSGYPALSLHHHQIQLKAFPPRWECAGRRRERVCVCVCMSVCWGVRGGGLEGEKGGGGDKRALSALLILYFTSGGCGALSLFPALWAAFTVLRETECHTNIHTHTHQAHCHYHSPPHPHTTTRTFTRLSSSHVHTHKH